MKPYFKEDAPAKEKVSKDKRQFCIQNDEK